MRTEQRFQDVKDKLIDGPWQDEPDRVLFKAHGFQCLILRQPVSGHLCGYVGVPEGHPWYGMDYNDVPAEVHGRLTYGEQCDDDPERGVCHVPEPGESPHLYWLGFDCAHLYDRSYMTKRGGLNLGGDIYRTVEYVEKHCTELARQAQEATA